MVNFNQIKPITGICKVCGTTINNTNYNSALGKNYCSWSCYETFKEQNATPNCKCVICNTEMYLKPSRIKRIKNGITCSKECSSKLKTIYMTGENNHQFGMKGKLNASFIGEKRINQYGYVMIYLPNHPKSDESGRYREHRYVIEQSVNYNDDYFDIINNQKVLKDCFIPHHINGIKTDNREENLVVITRSEHTSLHNNEKEIIKDTVTGKIIGVVKKDEFRGSLAEDNPEPSIVNEHKSSNEGAEHSS